MLNIRTLQAFRERSSRWSIRINDVGRAEAVSYRRLEYRPQEREIKYFLIDFVQRHYGRMRATRARQLRAVALLSGRPTGRRHDRSQQEEQDDRDLPGRRRSRNRRARSRTWPSRTCASRPTGPPSTSKRCSTAVPITPNRRREKYVANFVFVVKDQVPNALIPVNPLGLTITYFREDQAFE